MELADMTLDDTAPTRREQIIQGAYDTLRKNGLPHLSYDSIAAETGLTRQLIRYHFSSHEDLMLEVCDLVAAVYREALISTAGQLKGPARVDAFLDFYFDLLDAKRKPRDDQVYDAMLSLATKSRPIRENLANQYRLVGQVLSHEFSVQFPDLTAQAAEELSFLFVSLMYGHWKMVASLGFSEDHRHITRQAIDRLIRSYCDMPPEPGTKRVLWAQKGL
ncbi:MAG: TetR family transcriptional regulator [Pseudooceanicola sp.]|jgi:AcrR family transcriptional regulator|uniref:TetR/AcrR family transcriptional regulator n=2 Tax=Arenibacterium halophilum TaxID=2583821 RepID=A0ABY2X9U1_9RHOB|nr:TetR family transcriptional regulator [Pseudooceanicola sp.]TMV12818.1 TetR/AcrR family transcriptional regulator [Arenibacterium halophilum]